MMYRGNFSQTLVKGMHHEFVQFLDLKQREIQFDKVFNMETSEHAYEDEVEFAGLGPMPLKNESVSVVFDDAIQGGSKRYLMLTYALGVGCSFELFQDDQIGLIMKVPKCLARSGHYTKEMNAWNVLNLGNTTAVTTTDGLSLFNTAHPLLGGPDATNIAPGISDLIASAGTYPNTPVTAQLDLSISALQYAVRTFDRMPDARGIPVAVRPRHLLIPPELKWIAREILGSAFRPYSANNEVNSILGEDFDFMVVSYFTSKRAWFLTADKDGHQLKHFTRQELDEDFADDYKTRDINALAYMRTADGASNWIGTFGSFPV